MRPGKQHNLRHPLPDQEVSVALNEDITGRVCRAPLCIEMVSYFFHENGGQGLRIGGFIQINDLFVCLIGAQMPLPPEETNRTWGKKLRSPMSA